MTAESLFRRLRPAVQPPSRVQQRIKSSFLRRIDAPSALFAVRGQLAPAPGLRARVWAHIASTIRPAIAESIWEKVREALTPPPELRGYLQHHVLGVLTPAPQPSPYAWVKWVASLAVVALVVQASPLLFLATKTVADSSVILVPTRGDIAVSLGDLWQPVDQELVLEPGMRIRTYDGEASIIFRDDAVLRFDSNTIVEVFDTSEHVESVDAFSPSFSLVAGRVWVQGLLPAPVRGMTVAVRHGRVTVHEGSVSVQEHDDGAVAVKVWDRSADVLQGETALPLVVGEQAVMRGDNPLLTKKIPEAEFSDDWAVQNLEKDAVHRRSIAHLQHERRAASAGILPTSTLYPVKRAAEAVDVFFSVDEESRMQKRLWQANVRLNEAAALLTEGEEPDKALEDFRETLLALSSGTGSDVASEEIIRQSLAETIAEVAASLPGDESYLLKKTVLEVASDLPEEVMGADEAKTVLLVDSLTSLNAMVASDDLSGLEQTWIEAQPYLGLLDTEDATLDPQARKEAKLMLTRIARRVQSEARAGVATLDPELLADITSFLPQPPSQQYALMSDEEVNMAVGAILERVYAYKMPKSRENQLRVELRNLGAHPEQGRMLRAVYRALPEDSRLRDLTRREVVELRWEQVGEQFVLQQQEETTQSGSTIE